MFDPNNFAGIDNLKKYISVIQEIKTSENSNNSALFDKLQIQEYATALNDLIPKHAALLLSTQGLTNAQIAETLATNDSNVAQNYQAMMDAGLLKSKQSLIATNVQENLQTILGADADTKAAMAAMGLSDAVEGEHSQLVQLTTKKLEEAVATGALTNKQSQELAMRTGVMSTVKKQTASLPAFIDSVKGSTKAVLEQVAANAAWLVSNPAGWAILAVGAIAALTAGIYAYNKSIDTAVENAENRLNETKDQLSEISAQKEETAKKLKELESLEKNGKLSITDKEDLETLRAQNEELRIRQLYLERQKLGDNKEVVDTSKRKYKRDYGMQITSRESIDNYKTPLSNSTDSPRTVAPYLSDTYIPSYTTDIPGLQTQPFSSESDSLSALIAKYEVYSEKKQQAIKAGDQVSIDKYSSKLKETEGLLIKNQTALQEFSNNLSLTGESSPELDDVNNKLQLINDTLYMKEQELFQFIDSTLLDEDKQKLIELIEVGKLTPAELKQSFSGVDKYLKEIGFTVEDLIPLINTYKDEFTSTSPKSFTDTISALDDMASGWKSVNALYSEYTSNDFKGFSTDSLNGIIDSFKDIEGVDIESFLSVLTDSASTAEDVQSAFDKLSSQYIYSTGCLDGLTEATAAQTVKELEAQGIANASAIVYGQLAAAKEYAALMSMDLADASTSDIISFLNTEGASDSARESIAKYALQKEIANSISLSTDQDISQIGALLKACGSGVTALNAYNRARQGMIEIFSEAPINSIDPSSTNYAELALKQRTWEIESAPRIDKQKAEMDALMEDAKAEIDKALQDFEHSTQDDAPKKTPSSSTKAPTEKEEKKKDYDWISRATEAINRKRSDSQKLIDEETLSYHDQISALQELISLDEQLIDVTAQARDTYADRWEAVSADLLKVFGDEKGNALLAKITSGDTSLEGSKESYAQSEADIIDQAIKTYDEMVKSEDEYQNSVDEHTKNIRKMFEKRIAEVESYLDEVSNAMSQAQSKLDLKDVTGREVTEADYRQLISLSRSQTGLYYDQIKALEDQLETVDEFGPEYYSIKSSIASCESAIADAEKAQAEWNEEIKNLPIRKLERYNAILKNIKSDLQNWIDEQSVLGGNATSEQFQQLIDISKKQIDKLLEQQKLYKDKLSDYQWNSDKYNETAASIQDIDDEISGLIQSQKEWNQEILNIPINSISQLNEQLQSVSNAMGQVLDDYHSVVDAVVNAVEQQKEAVEDSCQSQMDAIDETISALQKEKEEEDSLLKVEQARADLERQKQQKTNQVIRDGEMQYEADMNAIRDAQTNYDNAKYDKQISDLNSAKDALQNALDQELEALDAIGEKWSQIADDIANAANNQLADQILGSGWKDKITSANGDGIYQLFQKNYETLASQKDAYDKQIASNENLISVMQTYVDAYLNGSISYEQAVSAMQSIAADMKDGFSSLDSLDAIWGTMTGNADSSLSSAIKDIDQIFGSIGDYFKSAEDNNNMLEDYSKTWEEMKADIAAQLKELEELSKKVAAIQEENRNYYNSSSNDSNINHISNGTIYRDGTYVPNDPSVPGYYTGSGKDLKKHHAGLYSGTVGSQNDPRIDTLKRIVELAPGEIPIIASHSEVLLTPEQINAIARNFSALTSYHPNINVPSLDLTRMNSQGANTEVNFDGDIILQGIQDPDGLARALKMNFRSAMRQRMSEK